MSMVPVKPYDIFAQAEAFEASATLLTEQVHSTQNMLLGITATVNRVFAVELYLKCLIAIENKPIPHNHRLKKGLFDVLNTTAQVAIEENYNAILPAYIPDLIDANSKFLQIGNEPVITDFYSVFSACENVFQELRYMFEINQTATDTLALTILSKAIRAHIIVLHPAWHTGYPAIPSNVIIAQTSIDPAKVRLPLGGLPKDGKQYVVHVTCPNANCQQQTALYFDMEPDLPFPAENPSHLPLSAFPSSNRVVCSKCYATVDYSGARMHIKTILGREPYFPAE